MTGVIAALPLVIATRTEVIVAVTAVNFEVTEVSVADPGSPWLDPKAFLRDDL